MMYDGSDDSKMFQYHIISENTGPLSQILESGRQYMFQVLAMNVDSNNFVSVGLFSDPQLFTEMTNRRIVKGIKSSTSIPGRRENNKELQLNTSNKQVKGDVLYIQKTHASSHESNYTETAPLYHNEVR